MRYKIEINLYALHQMSSNISLEEAVLLDYLYWLCSSPSEVVDNMRIEYKGRRYTWFNYSFYLEQTPILQVKAKSTITPKIKALEAENFIETLIDEKTGNKYVRILPKCDGLFVNMNTPVHTYERPRSGKRTYNKTNNNKTNNNIYCNASVACFSSNKNKDTAETSSAPLSNPLKDNTGQTLQEFMASCKTSKQRHIQIIGEWAGVVEPNYTTRGQWHSFIKRNVRVANNLTPFTDEQLQKAFDKLDGDIQRIDKKTGKKVGFITKFTLETLFKYV